MAVLSASTIFASGRKPPKSEIIQFLDMIQGTGSNPAVVKQTKAALDLVTPASENYGGLVLNDLDATKNGYYYRSSSTWVKGRGFPDTFAQITVGGTANAQTGTVAASVNPADILVYFATVSTANTGPMTLSISGEAARDVVNAAGNALSAGEWTGTVLFFVNGDGDYQLLFDAGAAASAAQSATNAAASAVAAAAFGSVDFDSVAELLADNNDVIGYAGSGASVEVAAGFILAAQGFRYEVAASGATDAHVETAGGVKLYVINDPATTVEAFGADASLPDNSVFFTKAIAAHGIARGMGGNHYKFENFVDAYRSFVIDGNMCSVQFGTAQALFRLRADVDYVTIENIADTTIDGVVFGDPCYKDFYNCHEDSSTIIGFPQGPDLVIHQAQKTTLRNVKAREARVFIGHRDYDNHVIVEGCDFEGDDYVVNPASLYIAHQGKADVTGNKFRAEYRNAADNGNYDVVKISGLGKGLRFERNRLEQLGVDDCAQIDLFTGGYGARIRDNELINVQVHRKVSKGTELVAPDIDLDAIIDNVFEFGAGLTGTPANPIEGAIYFTGRGCRISGNQMRVRLPSGRATTFAGILMWFNDDVYPGGGGEAVAGWDSIVNNHIDMVGSSSAATHFAFYVNGATVATATTVFLGNAVRGGDRFLNGIGGVGVGNQWTEAVGGVGTGSTSFVIASANNFPQATLGRDNSARVFTAASATPSVANTNLIRLTTGTTITNLLDGVDGQEVTIYARSAATVQSNANFLLKGAVDAAMPTRSVLKLIKVPAADGGWQEVSRSF